MSQEKLIRMQRTRFRIAQLTRMYQLSIIGAAIFIVGYLVLSHYDFKLGSAVNLGMIDRHQMQSFQTNMVAELTNFLLLCIVPLIGFCVQLYSFIYARLKLRKEDEPEARKFYQFNCKAFKQYQMALIAISIVGMAFPAGYDALMILATVGLIYLYIIKLNEVKFLTLK